MTELSIHEKIRNTLAVYDPKKVTKCIGTSALALQFEKLGWEHPTNDVDVLAHQQYIDELNERYRKDTIEVHAWADKDFEYTRPTDSEERSASFRPQNKYKDVLLQYQACTNIKDNHHAATYSDDLPVVLVDGFPCVDARQILIWKAKLMRPTDRETIQYTLDNPEIHESLGDTADELEDLMIKYTKQRTPEHGYSYGKYTSSYPYPS